MSHRSASTNLTVVMPLLVSIIFLSSLFLSSSRVFAQGSPPVGVRAAGMAGAFTAVADDATAAVWNPAGFASGSYFSLALDGNQFDHQSALFVGIGTPPLALTYYRSAIGGVANSRNRLVTHEVGVSLVQSLGNTGVAIGTTLNLVHGVTSAPTEGSTSANKFDADFGVMLSRGFGQIGLTVRNLAQPSFSVGASTIRLDRTVRGGVAVHAAPEVTIAADAEFTTAATVSGKWRDAAVGVESHPFPRASLRGGIHWNTAGGGSGGTGAAPIAAFGASYWIRGGLAADAQVSAGWARGTPANPPANQSGWGVGLRLTF